MENSLLIIFAKNPVLGKVKTRLAKTIGDEEALKIYNLLLRHTQALCDQLDLTKYVFYTDYIPENDIWSNGDAYKKHIQEGDELGSRMYNAFRKGFAEGYKSIAIIGTDCPELRAAHIELAFDHLKTSDTVIGPAKDGGYYLLGMNALHKELFFNKSWSTSSVFDDTVDDLKNLKISYELLPTLSDVDTEEDLRLMHEMR